MLDPAVLPLHQPIWKQDFSDYTQDYFPKLTTLVRENARDIPLIQGPNYKHSPFFGQVMHVLPASPTMISLFYLYCHLNITCVKLA